MKKLLVWSALGAVGAYLLGMFVAAVTTGAPVDWLVPQSGRPPRLLALLALGPIVLVGVVVLVVRLYRRWRLGRTPTPAAPAEKRRKRQRGQR